MSVEKKYPDKLPKDYYEIYDERAAIREHEGGMSKEEAEEKALEDCRRIWLAIQNKQWPWQKKEPEA